MSDFILDFWEKQAQKHRTSFKASWGDIYAISLEIDNIGRFISRGDRVLDVGCANGYSTLSHLKKDVSFITGIDFSEKMVEQAQVKKKSLGKANRRKVSFEKGDVRSLRFTSGTFDVVYTTRVLINLPSWSQQKQGIDECLRVCRKGGKVIFSEAFREPLVRLNSMRKIVGLSPLVEHSYNKYLRKDYLEKYLKSKNKKYKVFDFSSVYYLGSRFLRELVTVAKNYPGYSNPINKIFYSIEKDYSGGNIGIQQAYVIEK